MLRRFIPALLLLAGCQGAMPTAPAPPVDGMLDPEEQRFLMAGVDVAIRYLNGSVTTDPEWETSPLAPELAGVADEIALFQCKAVSIPESDNIYRARFEGETISHGFIQADQPNGWHYIPVYLTQTEPVQFLLFNSETDTSPLHAEGVQWNYFFRTLPKDDPAEPNDDDDGGTIADAALATPLPLGFHANRTLYQRTEGSNEDLEDWYRVTVQSGLRYKVDSRRNSNDKWGKWSYDIRCWAGGQVIAETLDLTGYKGDVSFTAPASGPIYIQIVGRPLTRRGDSVYYFQYSLGVDPKPPSVTAVNPTGALGLPLAPITFNAEVDSTVTSYNWQFDGGTIPATSTAASPAVLLNGSGTYNGTVTVANSVGTGVPFPFTYQVDYPTPPEWEIHEIESAGSVGKWNHTAVLNGRLVVVYGDLTGGPASHLKIARALVEAPTAPTDWALHTIDATAGTGWDPQVAISNGRLAISYLDANLKQLRFARALIPEPLVATDWTVHVLDPLVQDRQFTALAAPGGNFAVAWYNRTGDQQCMAIAETPEPAQASDWSIYPLESLQMGGGGGVVLLDNGTRLLCAYSEEFPNFDLRIAVASIANPPDATGWTTYALDTAGLTVGEYPSGAWHDGTPALAYFNRTSEQVRVARGLVALPTAANQWQIHDVAPAGDVGGTTSVVSTQGRLAVGFAHKREGEFKVARATAPWPTESEQWQVRTIDSSGSVGWYCSLAVLNESLIASYEYQTNTSLQIARALELW